MKHIAKRFNPAKPSSCCVEMNNELFHPLSYYLNGGIDLTGDSLRQTTEVEFDNDEELSELESEGASAVPYGDPRESKFSLVEKYGTYTAKAMADKSPNPTVTDVGTVTE